MSTSNPNPTNAIQQLLYSLAKGLNDTFDPAPPPGTATVGTPNPNTGAVTGSLGFPTGSGLTFTASQPSQGTVTVASDGTYTYTPTQTANPSPTDGFTATVHEGLSTTSVTVTVPVYPGAPPPPPVHPGTPAARIFTGDYSIGDFSQWPVVQNKYYNSYGKDYVPRYPATIVADPERGDVARFEVRSGDKPSWSSGERSQVQAGNNTGGTEGQTRWYQFSTKFDPTFPQNHADLGWGVTNGWHPNSSTGSGPFDWSVGVKNGYWSLQVNKQSSPGVYLGSFSIFDTPLDVGQWHDVKMQVHYSTSDTEGWIRLWHDGVRQTFVNGADTYYVRTLVPGTTTVYYKEGMYRTPMAPTDIVYTTGFRVATDEAGL